jgi:serine O-acetyltransferase
MVFSFITNKLGGYYSLRQKYLKSNSNLFKRLYSFIGRKFQEENCAYLPFENTIKGPINFLHGTFGVFISGGATIGKNCSIYQQVTIGSNMLIDSKGFGHPIIGDNCLIGAGAKIIGNVKIGNNCRIGANAVVSKDLPDNTVIVMGAAVITNKKNLINNTYQYSDNGWGYLKDGVFILENNPEKIAILNKFYAK